MSDVAEACQLMKQALQILDARGEHQSAALLDTAIHALPGGAADDAGDWADGVAEAANSI
jgi:hypothetical protein